MTDWPEIVARHGGLVWRNAYRLLGNEPDAADCYQEAFLAALELSRREPVRNWPALLAQLTTRKALDCLRRRRRQPRLNGEAIEWAGVPSPHRGPAQQVEDDELAERLREALTALPAAQAEVFCLRHVSELRYRQIARLLGLTTSGVGTLLHRARRRLAEVLAPCGAPGDVEVPR